MKVVEKRREMFGDCAVCSARLVGVVVGASSSEFHRERNK